ncbi:flagellar hook-associated protein FlgL [Calderihabitans maritimus]|uniref:Flagellar hook-associated protein FlgL n=1 Tax=Calderihabitans maritimus TaxID=1246530 RepID=A0A1Z5HTQ1_9FIRM|nr:flagellar hook-associated protein FlgL [Calderihabitans maritimus]GAW92904.1 flagellar hook-associated protein FlgL [Calderihabitans maritimus]
MRVTNKMLNRTVQNNMARNLERLNEQHNRLSSGKRVSRPSDDPVAAARIMALKTALGENRQYAKNVDDALSWLQTTETALSNATAVLQRIRELVVYAGNPSHTSKELETIGREIEQLVTHLVEIANTEYAGIYVFGGHRTQGPPYVFQGGQVLYQGDDGERLQEVAPGIDFAVNITGTQVFGGQQLFDRLISLQETLKQGQQLPPDALQEIDESLDRILEQRSVIGARVNRLEAAKERYLAEEVNLRGLLSKLEDIDFARAVMEYKMQQSVYEAALATAARMMQQSLVDFLR